MDTPKFADWVISKIPELAHRKFQIVRKRMPSYSYDPMECHITVKWLDEPTERIEQFILPLTQ